MSSFGAGGGSASQGTGGIANFHPSSSLGIGDLTSLLTQSINPTAQGGAIKPGQMQNVSPQQRFAQIMQQYGGGR